ncbi:DUF1707 domain-containing protein [Streptomyces sp. NPDC102279]|uniref:DUF1707 SHOCT-like domain-containing protein n=1 Tax=Streptomyces sp. NPDC102279 TaxID=3366153 RepID=UPI00380A6A90
MTADLPEPVHLGELRVSHADREAVVERLNEAAAEGRIDFTELDARLNQALTATTHADLAPVTADLPPVAASDPGQPLVLKGGDLGAVRAGRWQAPARVSVYGGRGGAKLDFTQATCRLSEVEVEVHGEEAGVTVIIPDGWAVEIGGMELGFSGLKDTTTPDRLPGTPLIRLTGTGGSAGVVIRHPNGRERRKLRRDQPR